MFKKFRRSSKAKVDLVHRNDSVAVSVSKSTRKDPVTFFDLPVPFVPGEIRNDIYGLIASSTKLHLFNRNPVTKPSKKTSSSSSSSTIPGLLLASKRTRCEYLPILLSLVPLAATITDFDFQPLRRVLGSLYPTELKALRTNPALTIQLRLRSCSDNVVPNLRRWCKDRADSLDRLPWNYVLQDGIPDGRVVWFAERVRVLFERVQGEAEKLEVQRVWDVLSKEAGGGGEKPGRQGQWAGGYGDDFFFVMASRKFASGST